jgi:hypothetical protein
MWWSHFDGDAYLALVRAAGFAVESAEARVGGNERWLWVLARKPAAG